MDFKFLVSIWAFFATTHLSCDNQHPMKFHGTMELTLDDDSDVNEDLDKRNDDNYEVQNVTPRQGGDTRDLGMKLGEKRSFQLHM